MAILSYTKSQVDASVAAAVLNSVLYIFSSGGTYALRSTVTASATQRVVWVGPSAPPIGSGYAINDIDAWEVGS